MTTLDVDLDLDLSDPRRALQSGGLLRVFNDAGVLSAADIHVARCLARLGSLGPERGADVDDEPLLLAVALAVRAPRLGHVCVDLATIRTTVSSDLDTPIDLQGLPWPDVPSWLEQLRASSLVGLDRPLQLEASRLYLDRYRSEEGQVATDLLERAGLAAEDVDLAVLSDGLGRLFAGDDVLTRAAAASAIVRRFSVIAGGPGTGKTTTVARTLALLYEQSSAGGRRHPLIGLAAPTGKAAARLEESVHQEANRLDLAPEVKTRLARLQGTTIHRLLGWTGNHTRFRHHRLNRLAHDVVVVDETSMVSLSLMARLVEAVRPDARLIVVGDPEQLASVEAGAVLGDIVGPVVEGLRMQPPARIALSSAVGEQVPALESSAAIGDGIVVLRKVHRFGGGIARLAGAIQAGHGGTVMDVLRDSEPDVEWLPVEVGGDTPVAALSSVRAAAVAAGGRVIDAARAGQAADAIAALGEFRLLCAHRHGPAGVSTWMGQVERWLADEVEGFGSEGVWYAGRPLLVTANDYSLRLYNGDTGVVVAGSGGRVAAAFERDGGVVEVSPTRLAAIDTVYAMTVHKAQGSQFNTVAVVLPDPDSPILTRELLYTAVTRARARVIVIGTEAAIRAAVSRPIARSSGLRERLWGD